MDSILPGWVVRGDWLYIPRNGSSAQAIHCDYLRNRSGVQCEDSLTVFLCLSDDGRDFAYMSPTGPVTVHLCQGDLAVLSAGCFHCGLPNASSCEVLFWYVDRHHDAARFSDSQGEVGALWSALSAEEKSAYCVQLCHVGGIARLGASLAQHYRIPLERASRRSSRGSSLPLPPP